MPKNRCLLGLARVGRFWRMDIEPASTRVGFPGRGGNDTAGPLYAPGTTPGRLSLLWIPGRCLLRLGIRHVHLCVVSMIVSIGTGVTSILLRPVRIVTGVNSR